MKIGCSCGAELEVDTTEEARAHGWYVLFSTITIPAAFIDQPPIVEPSMGFLCGECVDAWQAWYPVSG